MRRAAFVLAGLAGLTVVAGVLVAGDDADAPDPWPAPELVPDHGPVVGPPSTLSAPGSPGPVELLPRAPVRAEAHYL